jgi:glucokinase
MQASTQASTPTSTQAASQASARAPQFATSGRDDTLATSSALSGGLDLGGTKIQAIVVDAQHRIVGAARRPTPLVGGAGDVVDALALTLLEACREAHVAPSELAGVGIGTPGAVDSERGVVSNARNLPGFDGAVELARMLSEELGLRVRVGNDVGVALDAETVLGAGADHASFLGVWWGTGVGGGVVLNGRRWRGRGAAGEIGHTIVKLGGARCPCGRRGCLEAYAGRRSMETRARKLVDKGRRTVLFDLMEKKGVTRLTSGVWAKALAQNDKLATRLVDRALDSLAAALASSVNLLDLEAIVIGGGLGTRLGQPYADEIAHRMRKHLFRPDAPPPVLVSKLGDMAGALGASLLVARPVHAGTDA